MPLVPICLLGVQLRHVDLFVHEVESRYETSSKPSTNPSRSRQLAYARWAYESQFIDTQPVV